MDETKKAASVGQLKELHDLVVPRLEALESEDSKESSDSGLTQALGGQLVMLQQSVQNLQTQMADIIGPMKDSMQQCMKMCADMAAKPATDMTPVISAITALGVQFAQMAKPVTKTGEALLPNGEKITLLVSERRM